MRRRKMAAGIWTFLLMLSCCLLFTSADESTSCTHFAAVGKSYNVPLDADLTEGQRIIWKFNSKTLYDSKLENRGEELGNTHKVEKGSLILPKVTSDDAGSYIWQILIRGSLVTTKTVTLCVLESVSKPTVTFVCDEKLKVQFTCSGPQNATYHWFEGSNVIANENAKTLVRTSIQQGSKSFHCKVSNKVSSLSSDPVSQVCRKPSSPLSPGSPTSDEEERLLFGLNFWLMVGILAGGGGLVLVLIVATIICCAVNRRRRRTQNKDEQELRLQWSTGNNQHPQNQQHVNQRGHPHGHAKRPTAGQKKAQSSAGNTGPRPPRAKQNRPRPRDPITGQPLPGPRRHAETRHAQVPVNKEENPPPLPQPRKMRRK